MYEDSEEGQDKLINKDASQGKVQEEKGRKEGDYGLLDAILVELKNKKGLSAQDLAPLLGGISASTISRARKGNNPINCEAFLKRLKELFAIGHKETKGPDGKRQFIITIKDQDALIEESRKIIFVYYYTEEGLEVGKGLLTLYPDQKKANLVVYEEQKEELIPYVQYKGDITDLPENERFVLYFKERILLSSKSSSTKPSFCSFEGTYEDITSPIKIGVFASSERVASGMVVLELCDVKELEEKVRDKTIPPYVDIILHNARFNTNFAGTDVKAILRRAEEIKQSLLNIAGVYEGFLFDDGREIRVQKMVFEISPTGAARVKTINRQKGEMARIIDFPNQNVLVIGMGFNPEGRYYQTQIILDLKRASTYGIRDCFFGVYGGISVNGQPLCGRVLVFPVKEKERTYENLSPVSIPLSDQQAIQDLFEIDTRGSTLKQFFRGDLDTFADPPRLLEKLPLILEKENLLSPTTTIPHCDFYNNEQGLIELAQRIQDAAWCFNTRIIPETKAYYYTNRAKQWEEAIVKSVQQGLHFREVVSGLWVNKAAELKKQLGSDYQAVKVDLPYKSMLNFVVLKFHDDTEEVWFGWIVSTRNDLDGPCFRSSDKRLVDFFKSWYEDLRESGQEII